MMMMMAAAIVPGHSNQNLHRKRPWFDEYVNDRAPSKLNSNRRLSEQRKSWSHRQNAVSQPTQIHRDNLDKNADCEQQQKVIEELEYDNNQQQQQREQQQSTGNVLLLDCEMMLDEHIIERILYYRVVSFKSNS